MKEKYIQAVKDFELCLKRNIKNEPSDINKSNDVLVEMERNHKKELRKLFNVPEDEGLYGYVQKLLKL